MRFDALIFDLDGTILDSEPWHQAAEIEAFAQLGITITHEDLVPIVGRPLPEMLRMLGERFRPVSVEEFLAVEVPILEAMITNRMEAFADAVRLLERTRLPVALCTSSPSWYVERVFEQFAFLPRHFQVRVIGSDVQKGKPDPEPYLMVCDKLGIQPSRGLVIEDSANGTTSARAAGCFVVGVARHGEAGPATCHLRVSTLDHVLEEAV